MRLLALMLFAIFETPIYSNDSLFGKFHFSSICNVKERVKNGCSYELSGTWRFLDCVSQCFHFEECDGVSLDNNGFCFVHKDCPDFSICSLADDNHKYVESYCRHGSWNNLTQLCDCPPGYKGYRCEINPSGCTDVPKNVGKVQLYRILVDPEQRGENPFPVSCGVHGRSLVAFRNQGNGNFNRTWEEYKRGFFDDDFHQWLGMDAWHRLNNAGCDVMQLSLILNYNGKGYPFTFRRYRDTSLLDEVGFYKFNGRNSGIGGQGMPGRYMLPNCLGALSRRFSTWDRDNDSGEENCASRAGSGWWYPGLCDTTCNVLGLGKQHWNSTPSEQHFYLNGADLNSMMQEDSYMELIFMDC